MTELLELKELIRFTENDFDEAGNVKASRLMYQFQEIASHHADELGIGFDRLIKDNLIWVMSKLKFEIYEKPEPAAEYVLSTYPRPKKGVTYFRDYYIHDREGNLKAAAVAHWFVINFDTRRIERRELKFTGDYIDYPAFEKGIEKIKMPELIKAGVHVVSEEDLDVNRHMNNCRYADMIGEVTGKGGYREFIINFAHESMLGDEIELYVGNDVEKTVVVGMLEGGETVFQAGIVF